MLLRRLLFLCASLAIVALPAWAEPTVYDLLQMKRHYFANCLWSVEHGRMGGHEISGCLQGLGGQADSVMVYNLDGKFEMLDTLVGYLDSAPDNRSAVFEAWADGELLQKMGPLSSDQPPERMRVPLTGRRVLTMRIVPQRYDSTHGAAWGDPKLWTGLEGKIPGALLMNVDGQSMEGLPTVRNGKDAITIPVPLQPGVREYRVRVDYDEANGRVQVQTTEDTPAKTE